MLIPRDDLRVVFSAMVLLSVGHERPVRWPETIAFWRYLCKRKEKREKGVLFTFKCTDIDGGSGYQSKC
jgi:hypothetical protein